MPADSNLSIPIVDVTSPASSTSKDGLRRKIYVRSFTGFFQKIRASSVSILLLMYFGLAWLRVDESPVILFDIEARKFHLFGAIFWPQDFTLLAFALIIAAFGLFLITSLFGRIWCGYSCPQTIWSLMFIRVEEMIEGSRNQRIKLDSDANSASKLSKKALKHGIWTLLSLATALTFVGYFLPIDELIVQLIRSPMQSPWASFWVVFFTLATYLNAGWLREQVCIYMCPYARFQSVMFNENTMIVGYDADRGEVRGGRKSDRAPQRPDKQGSDQGDCVDCSICVQVCPVGIDIRDGLQSECIGCALCIDACDSVMTKLNMPTGLIRYASEKELNGSPGNTNKFDARAIGYAALLIVAVAAFVWSLVTRPQLELSAKRDRGALFYDDGLGGVENAFTLKVINKREVNDTFILSLNSPFVFASRDIANNGFAETKIKLSVGPGEVKTFPVTLSANSKELVGTSTDVNFSIRSQTDETLWADVLVNSNRTLSLENFHS